MNNGKQAKSNSTVSRQNVALEKDVIKDVTVVGVLGATNFNSAFPGTIDNMDHKNEPGYNGGGVEQLGATNINPAFAAFAADSIENMDHKNEPGYNGAGEEKLSGGDGAGQLELVPKKDTFVVAGGNTVFNPAYSPQGEVGAIDPLFDTVNFCPEGTFQAGPNKKNCEAIPRPFSSPSQVKFGATAKLADAANKSLPKENARLVKQVIGGLAGLTSAACVVSAYIVAEKARKEKSLLNKVLTGAAAAGTAAAALEIALQSYDLFMEKEQQPELGGRPKVLPADVPGQNIM